MIEVNWDENAIEAVKAFHWWLGDDANCGLELDETLGKFMEKVVARKATKTVADAVEQESEKWTHVHKGTKCKVLFSQDGEAWIKSVWNSELVPTEELKPIKPTISESEMMERIKYRAISIDCDDELGAKVREWLEQYEII